MYARTDWLSPGPRVTLRVPSELAEPGGLFSVKSNLLPSTFDGSIGDPLQALRASPLRLRHQSLRTASPMAGGILSNRHPSARSNSRWKRVLLGICANH